VKKGNLAPTRRAPHPVSLWKISSRCCRYVIDFRPRVLYFPADAPADDPVLQGPSGVSRGEARQPGNYQFDNAIKNRSAEKLFVFFGFQVVCFREFGNTGVS